MASPDVFVEYFTDEQARLYGPTVQQFSEIDAALGFAARPPANVTVVRVLQDGVEVPPPWAYPIQPGNVQVFPLSPLVPNPAGLDPASAASIGEVQQLIAESAAGFFRSMDPKSSIVAAINNSTTETNLCNADFSMPKITHESVWRMAAFGLVRNTSGGPVTFTVRLRNITDGNFLAAPVVTLASDAVGLRPWRLEVVGEGNTFLTDGDLTVGSLVVAPGSTDPRQEGFAQVIGTQGATDPHTWRLTGQFSVAASTIECFMYGAHVLYAIAGA